MNQSTSPLTQSTQTPATKKLLRLRQLCDKIGFKSAWIYKEIALGNFPKPINIGSRAVAWLESDIDEWIDEQATKSAHRK